MKKYNQDHILSAIKKRNKLYVWNELKKIGHNIEPNSNYRYLIFCRAFDDFDLSKNDNFINFYIRYLRYYRITSEEHFILNNTKTVMNSIMNELISPKEKKTNKIKMLSRWRLQ